MTLLYFAYGSNLWLPRLRHRVPGVEALGAARLPGFGLRWHKRSGDGSGKCSIEASPREVVYGGVYRIPRHERVLLDRVEELGVGYDHADVTVRTEDGEIAVYTYVATARARDDTLRPFTWYRDLVVAGAEDLRLPEHYVGALRAVEADPDPDPERERRQRAFLDPRGRPSD